MMGYHYRWKIGRKSAEIGRICKHVGGKMADGVPSAENRRNSAQNRHSVLLGNKDGWKAWRGKGEGPRGDRGKKERERRSIEL